jgi:hypothetical protein
MNQSFLACVCVALSILLATACGSGEQVPAHTPTSVAPMRRPTSQLASFTVQLEIRSGKYVDYKITRDAGGGFAGRRVPCNQQICTFGVRAGGQDLQFAVDSGRLTAPEIQHAQYIVVVRECHRNFIEVDSTILTCSFSF